MSDDTAVKVVSLCKGLLKLRCNFLWLWICDKRFAFGVRRKKGTMIPKRLLVQWASKDNWHFLPLGGCGTKRAAENTLLMGCVWSPA